MENRFHFYYWPIPFRGNFVRNLFAFTNTPYDETGSYDKISKLVRSSICDLPTPFMGPPLLGDRENNISISQMSAIVFYLSEQLDLMPNDVSHKSVTIKVLNDCTDLLAEITRSNGAHMWTQSAWDEFVSTRFVRWLQIFENTAKMNGASEMKYFFGTSKAGSTDLAYHALLATMERCLPQTSPILRQHAPLAMNICERVGANKGIQKLVDTQTETAGDLYCGGEIEKSIRQVMRN